MHKWTAPLLALSLALFLAIQLRPSAPSVQGQGAPSESIHCADANGDQRVDVSDAIGILNYLFVGEHTPHCIAEGSGVVGRAEYDALLARVEALEAEVQRTPRFVTGRYEGDGTDRRMVETGLPGTPEFVRVFRSDGPEGAVFGSWNETLLNVWSGMGDNVFGLEPVDGGFWVNDTYSNATTTWENGMNMRGTQYFWVAMHDGR